MKQTICVLLSLGVCLFIVSIARPYNFIIEHSGGSAPTGTPSGVPTLSPQSTPGGTVTILNSNLCGTGLPTQHTAFQAALTAAAGGTLWIPTGCVVNLNEENDFSSYKFVACAGDGVAGFHNLAALACSGAPGILQGHGVMNVTVEGCAMTGTYVNTPTNRANARSTCPSGIANGGGTLLFFGGSNITVTNNSEKGTYADEGFFFDGTNGCTVSKNVFVDNCQNGMQLSNAKSCNVTSNYSQDGGWDLEDNSAQAPGTSTGTWSSNTFTIVNGCGINLGGTNPTFGWGPCTGLSCSWNGGIGCSHPGCNLNEYNGVTFSGNTVKGTGAGLLDSASIGGATFTNNSFANGGQYCKGS